MRSISLLSPAKLNLFLKVTGKRPDGYHNLVTLFERIDLCDEIELKLNKDGNIRIHCDHKDVPVDSRNLTYKVAKMLQDDFALQNGVDIFIKKNIPVAAGLGGGSSNAATTLMGLNEVWQLSLSQREMLSYGRAIGSDVPFFLSHCSWGLGTERGDKIRKVPLKAKLWHLLLVPRIKMYTKKVYGGLNLRLTKKKDDVNILIRALRINDLSKAGHFLLNDLEPRILELAPKLGKLQKKLKALDPQGVAFSGSGPSIFALAESYRQAEEWRLSLKKQYREVFVVRTL